MKIKNKYKFSLITLQFSLLLASLVSILSSCLSDKEILPLRNGEVKTYKNDGQDRIYIVYKPQDLPENAPLLLALHGYLSNAIAHEQYTNFNSYAEKYKFVVAYPQGTLDKNGIPHWNANLEISDTDDIGFLTSLTSYLQETYNLNPAQTFVSGFSNGGFMSYSLACDAPEQFRAIASIEGTMSKHDWENCSDSPMPVLQITGEDDIIVSQQGLIAKFEDYGWGGAPNIDVIMEYWAEKNHTTTLIERQPSPLVKSKIYTNDTNNNEVWFYLIENFGHEWPGGPLDLRKNTLNASEIVWKFFSRY